MDVAAMQSSVSLGTGLRLHTHPLQRSLQMAAPEDLCAALLVRAVAPLAQCAGSKGKAQQQAETKEQVSGRGLSERQSVAGHVAKQEARRPALRGRPAPSTPG